MNLFKRWIYDAFFQDVQNEINNLREELGIVNGKYKNILDNRQAFDNAKYIVANRVNIEMGCDIFKNHPIPGKIDGVFYLHSCDNIDITRSNLYLVEEKAKQ